MPKDTGLEELLGTSSNEPEVLTFYNGEVTLYYDDKLHAYYVIDDGQKILVPGSTTVGAMIDKSQPLMWWASDQNSLYVIDNIEASPAARQQLAAMYTLFKAKEPVDATEAIQLTVTTHDLAKLLKEGRGAFDAVRKQAADIGSVAHEWLEGYVKAEIAEETYTAPLPMDDPQSVEKVGAEGAVKATNCVLAALEWFKRHKIHFVCSERKVYSHKYNYAGTADWFAWLTSCGDTACCPFEGMKFTCGDFKSSKSLHEDYYVQLASYQQAWNEEQAHDWMYKDESKAVYPMVELRLLLRIDKEGNGNEVKIRPVETFEPDFDAFLGALSIYGWSKQMELDRRYERAVKKAEKDAAKAAAAKPNKKRAPRKVVIKEVAPTFPVAEIPMASPGEELPWEGEPRFKTPPKPLTPELEPIPMEMPS